LKEIAKKEEGTKAVRVEITFLTQKILTLEAEIERINIVIPQITNKFCEKSDLADQGISCVKKLEIRAMLADQTTEEMEQQVYMSKKIKETTNLKIKELTKKLESRQQELEKAVNKAKIVNEKLNNKKENLKSLDFKMASKQYELEKRKKGEIKIENTKSLLQKKIQECEERRKKEYKYLQNIKQNIEFCQNQNKKTVLSK